MAIDILVPRLGWSMEDGTFVGWLKKPGEAVQRGEPLFTLENDKAAMEVETFEEGILHLPGDAPQPGERVLVGQRIGLLLADGESAPSGVGAREVAPMQPTPELAAVAQESWREPGPSPAERSERHSSGKISSPRARRVARELAVDWTSLSGSGRNGRVREVDVRQAAGRANGLTALTPAQLQRIASVTWHATVDLSELLELPDEFQRLEGDSPLLIPRAEEILWMLVATALRNHPAINARWENGEVRSSKSVDLEIVREETESTTRTNIRDAANCCLREFARRAREQKGMSEAATFTIADLGAWGIEAFTPVICFPQCAILGVGRLCDGALTLSLTFDDRAIAPREAARFFRALREFLTSPLRALLL